MEKCLSQDLFDTMKYEVNRLQSFKGKWPLRYVKPKDLAESGFFYLQAEDRVQCAFCHRILDDWNVGDKPAREHMRKSPRCPFVMKCTVGNVPSTPPTVVPAKKYVRNNPSSSHRPKYPRLADTKLRLGTYTDWPLIMLSPRQLAECGLYYTGVADVVTCFFCGGSLGNWDSNDDPWLEHKRFFPYCAYISLINRKPNASTMPEIVRRASEIFPRPLVHEVVTRPFGEGDELCSAVLEEQTEKLINLSFEDKTDPVSTVTPVKDILLCKICMDREKGIVFLPCGHLVACPQCGLQIVNCPICRLHIENKVRTYLS